MTVMRPETGRVSAVQMRHGFKLTTRQLDVSRTPSDEYSTNSNF